MIETIYVESALRAHPLATALGTRFPAARVIECDHYGEVFNRRRQHFRAQKSAPSLLVAEKTGRRVLPVPAGYGLDGADGYYFSHMLNCLYDCRYCFLQGMFRSAHYVLFVNYEDFMQDICAIAGATTQPVWFFSGYDCDSLALEPVTGFAAAFLPLFEELDNAWLELRTKSTQVAALLARTPCERVVTAFSLSPDIVADRFESRTPQLARRLSAAARLADAGWPIALRFDPVILVEDFFKHYGTFFDRVCTALDGVRPHSITLGAFRLPPDYFQRMQRMFPDEALFAGTLEQDRGGVTYPSGDRLRMLDWCRDEIAARWPQTPLYEQGDA